MAETTITVTVDDAHIATLLAVTGDSTVTKLRTRLTDVVEHHVEKLLDTWRAGQLDSLRKDLSSQPPAVLQRVLTAARNELTR